MKTTAVAVTAILAIATFTPAMAETPEELKTQIAQVDRQMQEAIRRNTESAEIKRLQEAMSAAQKALGEAVAALPAAKELDGKIDKVRKDLVELQKQRMDLIAKSPELAAARQAAETTRQAYHRATVENSEVAALRAQRMELVKKLMEISRPEIPTPGPEK